MNTLVEWRILKTSLLAQRKNHEGKLMSFHDVYIQLIIHDPDEISNVLVIVEVMIIISSSTAGCESPFHMVNLVKNKLRTRLHNDTMNILLKIAACGKSIQDFDSQPIVDLWTALSTSKDSKDLQLWNVKVPNILVLVK